MLNGSYGGTGREPLVHSLPPPPLPFLPATPTVLPIAADDDDAPRADADAEGMVDVAEPPRAAGGDDCDETLVAVTPPPADPNGDGKPRLEARAAAPIYRPRLFTTRRVTRTRHAVQAAPRGARPRARPPVDR